MALSKWERAHSSLPSHPSDRSPLRRDLIVQPVGRKMFDGRWGGTDPVQVWSAGMRSLCPVTGLEVCCQNVGHGQKSQL